MARDKKVQVSIIGEAKKFREELKAVQDGIKSSSQAIDKQAKKDKITQDKDFREHQSLFKLRQTYTDKAINLEKKLSSEIRSKTDLIVKLSNKEEKAREKTVKQLGRLTKEYQAVQKARKLFEKESKIDLPDGGGGGPGGGGPGGGGGGLSKFAGGIATFALRAAKMFFSAVQSNVAESQRLSEGLQRKAAEGVVPGAGLKKADLIRMYEQSTALGFMPDVVTQVSNELIKQAGARGAQNIEKLTNYALKASRIGGVNPGEIVSLLTAQAQGGKMNRAAARELGRVMTASHKSALKGVRVGEYLKSVQMLMQRAFGQTSGVVRASDIAAKLNMLGRGGAPGLLGARGASMAARLDQAIRQPGAGEAGDAFIKEALGWGPNSMVSFFDVVRQQQRGFLGKGGEKTLRNIIERATTRYGTDDRRSFALSRVLKVTMDQAEEIIKAVETNQPDQKLHDLLQKAVPRSLAEINTDLLDAVKHAAQETTKLVKNVDGLDDKMRKLQEQINNLLTKGTPLIENVVSALTTLTKTINTGINVITQLPMFRPAPDNSEIKERVASILGEARENKISEREARQKLTAFFKEATDPSFAGNTGLSQEERVNRAAPIIKDAMEHLQRVEKIERDFRQRNTPPESSTSNPTRVLDINLKTVDDAAADKIAKSMEINWSGFDPIGNRVQGSSGVPEGTQGAD